MTGRLGTYIQVNTNEKTKRNSLTRKWVKITHKARNVYIVAFGFEGCFKAVRIQQGSKDWSEIASKNWLEDNG